MNFLFKFFQKKNKKKLSETFFLMPSRMTFFKFAFLLYFSLGIFCSFLFFQVEAKEQKTDWKMFGLGIFLTVFLTDSFNLFRWKTKSSNKEMYGEKMII